MRIDVHEVLPADLRDEAWRFYTDTFGYLAAEAAERHLMDRGEFDHMMTDPRVRKYTSVRDAAVIGLAALTDDLDAVPLISPPYFQRRWPDLYAQRRIVYCIFIGAQAGPAGSGVFVAMQREMYDRWVGPSGAAVVLDMCGFNEYERKLPQAVAGILGQIAGPMRTTRVDSQSWWLYEFPERAG